MTGTTIDAWYALAQVVNARRAVRGFLPTPLPVETIERALSLAGRAPSNCNVQPWVVHVASGAAIEELRTALSDAARRGEPGDDDFGSIATYPGHYRTRQVETAQALYGAIGVERHDREGRLQAALRNFSMFGAPHAAFLFVPEWVGPRELADAGGWAQTFMLALTACGAASLPQAALGRYPGITRRVLGVPDGLRLLYGIAFGNADSAAPANQFPIGRAPLHETVTLHA